MAVRLGTGAGRKPAGYGISQVAPQIRDGAVHFGQLFYLGVEIELGQGQVHQQLLIGAVVALRKQQILQGFPGLLPLVRDGPEPPVGFRMGIVR